MLHKKTIRIQNQYLTTKNMQHKSFVYLLSTLLTLSALLKAVNIYSFSSEIQLYIEAYMPIQFVTFHVEASIIICSMELLAALFITSRDFILSGSVLSFFYFHSFYILQE